MNAAEPCTRSEFLELLVEGLERVQREFLAEQGITTSWAEFVGLKGSFSNWRDKVIREADEERDGK